METQQGIATTEALHASEIMRLCDARQRHRAPYMIWLIVSAMVSAFIYMARPSGFSDGLVRFTLLHYWIIVGVHVCYHVMQGRPRNPLSPDFIFIICYSMFHYSYVTLFALGVAPFIDFILRFPEAMPGTMFVANLGMIAFILGFEAMGFRQPAPATIVTRPAPPPPIWGVVGVIVIFIALLFHLGTLAAVGIKPFIEGGYWALFHMEWYIADPRYFHMSTTIFVMGLVLYCSYSSLRYGKLFASKALAFISAMYLLLVLIEGSRTAVGSIVISLIIIRHYMVKPIKVRWLIGMLVASLISFAAINLVRRVTAFDIGTMIREIVYLQTSGEFHWYLSLMEMGGSFRTLNLTVAYVPHTEPFWFGRSYAIALVQVPPFVSGLVYGPWSVTPAGWATHVFNPMERDPSGAGFLTSAEGYLNGGHMGVIVWMAFVGVCTRFFARWFCFKKHMPSAVVMIVAIGTIAFMVRQNAAVALRPIVWTWVMAAVVNLLAGRPGPVAAHDTRTVESATLDQQVITQPGST